MRKPSRTRNVFAASAGSVGLSFGSRSLSGGSSGAAAAVAASRAKPSRSARRAFMPVPSRDARGEGVERSPPVIHSYADVTNRPGSLGESEQHAATLLTPADRPEQWGAVPR